MPNRPSVRPCVRPSIRPLREEGSHFNPPPPSVPPPLPPSLRKLRSASSEDGALTKQRGNERHLARLFPGKEVGGKAH